MARNRIGQRNDSIEESLPAPGLPQGLESKRKFTDAVKVKRYCRLEAEWQVGADVLLRT